MQTIKKRACKNYTAESSILSQIKLYITVNRKGLVITILVIIFLNHNLASVINDQIFYQ